MTLGIGLQCEQGVALVTDSMVLRANPGSTGVTALIGGRKLHWLPGHRAAAVLSMAYDATRGDLAKQLDLVAGYAHGGAEKPDLEARLGRLYAEAQVLDSAALAKGTALSVDPGDSPQLLAAGGNPPRLICITPNGTEIGQPGSVFAIGGWLYTAPQTILDQLQQPAPPDLHSCVTWALGRIRAYIIDRYGPACCTEQGLIAFIRERGQTPHVAPPYDVATFTSTNFQQQEVAA